ncbi:TetR family transcriptional regulator [candidate division KSB1 bacterium]|nr:TetR family transcriptional regulator [candidate division KSB1 bacterium]
MPKIVDKEQKKMEILISATRVFARMGFANTKMIDIAEEAKIGKGTIYEYFKNKDEIFEYAFHHFMQTMEEGLGADLSEISDPVQKLKTLAYSWGRILAEHEEDIVQIMLDFWAEAIRQKDESRLKIIDFDRIYDEYRGLVMTILDQGIRQGKFKPVNTFYIASLIVGMIDGVMLQYILDKENFDPQEALRCFAEELIVGICK